MTAQVKQQAPGSHRARCETGTCSPKPGHRRVHSSRRGMSRTHPFPKDWDRQKQGADHCSKRVPVRALNWDRETLGSDRIRGEGCGLHPATMDAQKRCRLEEGLESLKHPQAGPRPSPPTVKYAGKQRGRECHWPAYSLFGAKARGNPQSASCLCQHSAWGQAGAQADRFRLMTILYSQFVKPWPFA